MVPGRRVVPWERKAMSSGTEKIMSEVLDDCTTSPFTVQLSSSAAHSNGRWVSQGSREQREGMAQGSGVDGRLACARGG